LTEADTGLLLRSAAGDRAAYDAFVERHQDWLYRYLVAIAGNRADAEDALQEAFLAAWRGAGSFRGDGPARAWLVTIARRVLIRSRRLAVDEPLVLVPLNRLGLDAGWGDPAIAPLPDSADGRRALLAAALERLRPDEREVRKPPSCSGSLYRR
jgi:RNA polymerase sigma-70 factor (ECF subfamily)